MILNPSPLKYTVHRDDTDLNWYIEPPVMDLFVHRGPFQRHADALAHVNAHIFINSLRPGAISEEGFHVDSAE